MRATIHAAVLLCILAVMGMHAHFVQADADDWKDGWNTWKTTHKGDWVTYAIGGEVSTKWEVTGVDAGPKLTYTFTQYDGAGNELVQKQYTKEWDKIKLASKPPYKITPKWETADYEYNDIKVACDVCTWVQADGTTGAIYYSKEVPCGGIAKVTTNGTAMVWLTGFEVKDAKKDPAADNGAEKPAENTGLPKFFSTLGNLARYKTGPVTWQQFKVIKVEGETATYTVQSCTEDGRALPGRAAREMTLKAEDWNKDHAKAIESGVKLTADGTEYTCSVYEYSLAGKQYKDWVSDGVLVKRVEKISDMETTLELIKLELK